MILYCGNTFGHAVTPPSASSRVVKDVSAEHFRSGFRGFSETLSLLWSQVGRAKRCFLHIKPSLVQISSVGAS